MSAETSARDHAESFQWWNGHPDLTEEQAHFRNLQSLLRATVLLFRKARLDMVRYIIIERQHGPMLAVRYKNQDDADKALTNSNFIDGLCQEDCLDAFVTIDNLRPDEAEVIHPPREDDPPFG